jgi:hypothetical protein
MKSRITGAADAGQADIQRFNFNFLPLENNTDIKTGGNSCSCSSFLYHFMCCLPKDK